MALLVALTGFMGSGKTSVGTLVAGQLGWRFVDLDDDIARSEGMTVADFFARHGEEEFRVREVKRLGEVLALTEQDAQSGREPGLVLGLGGGTLVSREAVEVLEKQGGVVYLDVDPERAWQRAHGPGRPLAQEQAAFATLLASRRDTYEQVADWIIPVGDHSAEQVAREIARVVRAAGSAWPSIWGLQLVSTSRPSTIVGGRGCLVVVQRLAAEVGDRGGRLFVITDRNVQKAWGGTVRKLLGSGGPEAAPLVLTPGERSKSVRSLERCWDQLATAGARRDDVVLALGGGVVGDLAGFAAATYQRGVTLWQIPTSLLAQVDSSVGGKTAINLKVGKNLVGAFYQPEVVVIDPDTLATLPQAEFTNGLGEVVKYGMLSGETMFRSLEEGQGLLGSRDPDYLSQMVRACVRCKADVVGEDERDTGRRAVLNLGHTTAHALEAVLGYGKLGHGHAVGLGLLVALAASEKLLGLDVEVRQRTEGLLRSLGLPTSTALPPLDALAAAAGRDKKVTAGSSGFVGLRGLGDPVWGVDLPGDVFREALGVIRA